MPLFEVGPDGLIPFRQLAGDAATYDQALEDILWSNLDSIVGEQLMRVRRQAPLMGGGGPAVVALDRHGGVVVVHARWQISRVDLAECLEYAAWARATTIEEIAGLYWLGAADFWGAWREFTADSGPQQLNRVPRLVLVTSDFTGRAGSTFDFLVDSGVPVQVLKAGLYADERGRRLLEVQGQDEIAAAVPRSASPSRSLGNTAPSGTGLSGGGAPSGGFARGAFAGNGFASSAPPSRRALSGPPPALTGAEERLGGAAGEPQSPSNAEEQPSRVTADVPYEQLGRASRRASEWTAETVAHRTHDPLRDPLGGELLPPAELTAEQLRRDPLGVDQIVSGRFTVVEPGTPEPAAEPVTTAGNASDAHGDDPREAGAHDGTSPGNASPGGVVHGSVAHGGAGHEIAVRPVSGPGEGTRADNTGQRPRIALPGSPDSTPFPPFPEDTTARPEPGSRPADHLFDRGMPQFGEPPPQPGQQFPPPQGVHPMPPLSGGAYPPGESQFFGQQGNDHAAEQLRGTDHRPVEGYPPAYDVHEFRGPEYRLPDPSGPHKPDQTIDRQSAAEPPRNQAPGPAYPPGPLDSPESHSLPRRLPPGPGGFGPPSPPPHGTDSEQAKDADLPGVERPQPDGDQPERARPSDRLDPRILRVPDAPVWDPRSANGYHRDNGR
jgi:hypothetical protein